MVKKNVTLSLEGDTYENYKKHCQKNGIALSRSIEIFMEDQIKEGSKND